MTSRAENQAPNLVSSIPWGDRTRLLPKATAYAFSLDVRTRSDGPYLSASEQQSETGLRHLFSQPMVEMPEGLRCDVPTGKVISANGEIGDASDPRSNWFRLRVLASLGSPDTGPTPSKYAATLSFSCTGVLNLAGGPTAYRLRSKPLSGSAFIASIQESSSSAYRWLERRQLFGIGRVTGTSRNVHDPSSSSGWDLRFTFDLYGGE